MIFLFIIAAVWTVAVLSPRVGLSALFSMLIVVTLETFPQRCPRCRAKAARWDGTLKCWRCEVCGWRDGR